MNNELDKERISVEEYFAREKKQTQFREFASVLAGRAYEDPNKENIGNLVAFSFGSEKFLKRVEPNSLIAVMSLYDGAGYFSNPVIADLVKRGIEEYEGEPEGYLLSALRTYAIANKEFKSQGNKESLKTCLQRKNRAKERVEEYGEKAQKTKNNFLKSVYEDKFAEAKGDYEAQESKLARGYVVVEEEFDLAEKAYARRSDFKKGKSVDGVIARTIAKSFKSADMGMVEEFIIFCAESKAPLNHCLTREFVDAYNSGLSYEFSRFNDRNYQSESMGRFIQTIVDDGMEIYEAKSNGAQSAHATVKEREVAIEEIADIFKQGGKNMVENADQTAEDKTSNEDASQIVSQDELAGIIAGLED